MYVFSLRILSVGRIQVERRKVCNLQTDTRIIVQGCSCHSRHFQVGLATFLNRSVHCGLSWNSPTIGIQVQDIVVAGRQVLLLKRGCRPLPSRIYLLLDRFCIGKKALTSHEGMRSSRLQYQNNPVPNKSGWATNWKTCELWFVSVQGKGLMKRPDRF